MKETLRPAIVLGLGLIPLSATAAGIHANQRILCSTIEAVECGAGEDNCFIGPATSINMPHFVRVDVKNKEMKELRVDGEGRRTVIENIKDKEGQLILQGADGDYAWSAEVQKATGKLVLTAAGDDVGFIIFGACIPD